MIYSKPLFCVKPLRQHPVGVFSNQRVDEVVPFARAWAEFVVVVCCNFQDVSLSWFKASTSLRAFSIPRRPGGSRK